MTLGNLVALQQTQVVRLLAYSGIAQAGYMLLPFALVSADAGVNAAAFSAAVAYLLIYAVMNLGAFAVVTAVSRRASRAADRGLQRPREGARRCWAIGMTVFMVSLAGVPPTGGFWAKLLIFQAAIDRGGIGVALAVVMLVNSVVSISYYFAVPRAMIFRDAATDEPLRPSVLVTAWWRWP